MALIDKNKNYMWTSQEVVKGRFRYRVFGMKLIGGIGTVCIITSILILVCLDNGVQILKDKYSIFIFNLFILLSFFIGWRVGTSFDGQSIELEAILKKLEFHKPSHMDLQHFALNDLSWNNKEDNKGHDHERWKDYTYRIDLAQQADAEKYGK